MTSLDRNCYSKLDSIVQQSAPHSPDAARIERGMAITAVILLIIAVCAFAGAFGNSHAAQIVGFSFLGAVGLLILAKAILLSLLSCHAYFDRRAQPPLLDDSATI